MDWSPVRETFGDGQQGQNEQFHNHEPHYHQFEQHSHGYQAPSTFLPAHHGEALGTSSSDPHPGLSCSMDTDLDLPLGQEHEFLNAMHAEIRRSASTETHVELQDKLVASRTLDDVSLQGPRLLFVVLDTNILLSHLDYVNEILKIGDAFKEVVSVCIVIPGAVVRELDGLKQESSQRDKLRYTIGAKSRKVIAWIQKHVHLPALRGESWQQEKDARAFFPDPDEISNDARILACAMLIKAAHHTVTVFTNDINMVNMASFNKIHVRTMDNFPLNLPAFGELYRIISEEYSQGKPNGSLAPVHRPHHTYQQPQAQEHIQRDEREDLSNEQHKIEIPPSIGKTFCICSMYDEEHAEHSPGVPIPGLPLSARFLKRKQAMQQQKK
eukprot:m.28350 g.28350  ORF g.28350 m.28350 type:complete len:383 (+) comp7996_c0_seq1:280-1428(+)